VKLLLNSALGKRIRRTARASPGAFVVDGDREEYFGLVVLYLKSVREITMTDCRYDGFVGSPNAQGAPHAKRLLACPGGN